MSQPVFPAAAGIFLPDLAQDEVSAPQLVMLANVVVSAEASASEYSTEEKQMVELQTVACSSYSDSEEEDEAVVRYSLENSEDLYAQQTSHVQPEPVLEEVEIVRVAHPPNQTENTENVASAEQKRTPLAILESSKKKKKPFFCKPCQYQGENEEEFIVHIRTHGAKKMLVVNGGDSDEDLSADAGPQTSLSNAENAESNSKGVIRCERCGYNTNRFDHYMAHLKHHTKEGEDQRVFKCTICAYTTISQYHWKKHLRNHFPSKLFTCSQCSYFSDRKNNYIQHIRTHTGERPFQCIYCEYSSSQKTHLTRHMRTHSGERPFKCDNCSYLAANQHEVTRHARQVHNGPKPLSCPYCQYKTADRSNFKKHVELHVNPRQFLCPVCKYAASKKCNLQYHIKSRHPGCTDISMDVSKVRLRVKRSDGEDGSPNKLTADQAKIMEELEDAGPINLSIRKPNKLSIVVETEKSSKKNMDVTVREKPGKANQLQHNEKKSPSKHDPKEKNLKKLKGKTSVKDTEETQSEDRRGNNKKETKKVEKPAEKAVRSRHKKEKPVKDSSVQQQSDAEEQTQHTPQQNQREDNRLLKQINNAKDYGKVQTKKPCKKQTKTLKLCGETQNMEEDGIMKQKAGKRKAENPAEPKQRIKRTKKEDSGKPTTSEGNQTNPEVMESERSEADKSDAVIVESQNPPEAEPQPDVEPPSVPDHLIEKAPVVEEVQRPLEEEISSVAPDPPEVDSGNEMPSPTDSDSAPGFSPTLPLQHKPTDAEDDEGIHSNDGGSDISDSASEGSYDSGLMAGAEKLPETPTEESDASAARLLSHTCIFCDRSFTLEMDYRRHLNRHLVNVYYLEGAAQGDK